jgi:hypothetical protein
MGVTLMDGVLYIADSRNNAIRAVSVSTGKVTTVSGSGEAGSTDGKAKDARLSSDNNILIWKLTHSQHNASRKARDAGFNNHGGKFANNRKSQTAQITESMIPRTEPGGTRTRP